MQKHYFDELDPKIFIPAVILFTIIFYSIFLCGCEVAWSHEVTASWYSTVECKKINPSLLMANGKKLNDHALTAASWHYPLGTKLKITNKRNKKHVIVKVTDRGPAKRLVKIGRKIDLSRKAFASIANLKHGIIPITVERR